MRTPQDLAAPLPRAHHRWRWWIVGLIAVLVLLLASLRSLATVYTDDLWFSSVGFHSVWSTLLAVKVGLFVSFGAVFFALMWTNLVVCDKIAMSHAELDADDELVRRYQKAVRPYAGRIYAGIALVLGLIAGAGAIGEWNNWILFTHGGSFGTSDPQFHMDIGFYVFKLPFFEFLVDWLLVALLVVAVITAVFHYLNGGIRTHQVSPRVRPAVRGHLSVILAAMAIVKAAGYVLQRYQLVTSTNGYVEGAGYADVHYRVPAMELLFWVCLGAAAVLLWNAWRQTWVLPLLAVGGWAFVALAAGVIFPKVEQAITVDPAQISLEKPYIERNIAATRLAYGINDVKSASVTGTANVPTSTAMSDLPSLEAIRIWDPNSSIALPTFQKVQGLFSYYTFETVGVDRYKVGGKLTPVLVGVRQINASNLQSTSWVTTHLEYTHGEGIVVAAANASTSTGDPDFGVRNVPPVSEPGFPQVRQPDVYFGIDQPGYVVADTRTSELEEALVGSADATAHYQGTGGVRLDSFLTRAAFAVRLGDLNLLLSDQITGNSRIMFVRDVQQMAAKAAPFLTFDSDPYAVLVDGQIDWVLNGYTTTDEYPYSQNADTTTVPGGSGLPSSYNYVRSSVTVVVNAYSGKMTFYAMDDDPILRAYESAFPHLFTPSSAMSSALRAHLRYPENIFAIQAAMYGRYHLTTAATFSSPGDAWTLSPTAGVGSPSQALAVAETTNARGQTVSGPLEPMAPEYEVLEEPGENYESFSILDAFVPSSNGDPAQNLTAYLMGNSGPRGFGQLRAYVTPVGQAVVGPAQADSEIEQKAQVSAEITALDQHGSKVVLGNLLIVPIGQSVLYVRPLYVESTGNPAPQLREVIAVLGQNVRMETSLDAVLSDILNIPVGSSNVATGPTSSSVGSDTAAQIEQDLEQADSDYSKAQQALKTAGAGGLANYEADIQAMDQEIGAAQKLLTASGVPSGGTASSGSSSTSSTTATAAGTSSTALPASSSGQSSKTALAAKHPTSSGTTTTSSGSEQEADGRTRSAAT